MSKIRKIGEPLTDKEIARKYKGAGLITEVDIIPDDALWIPSTNIYLNWFMGGGLMYGRIAEVYGGESSGKTLLAMDFSSVVHSLGGVVLWNDAEQVFDKYWAKDNGMDLSRTYIFRSTKIEQVSDWVGDMAIVLRKQLTNNEPILFVCDSIAALDVEDNIDSSQVDSKAEMGNRAKALYKWLRIRNEYFAELGITLLFINQLRKKVGALFEDPDTTPAGNAMKFYASHRLAFFQKKQITRGNKENKIWLGNQVSIRMKKCKVAPPRPPFTTEIYFNKEYVDQIGFSKYVNMDRLFLKSGVVERKGRSYYFKDEKIAGSKDEFATLIQENGSMRRKILKETNVNTTSKTRKQLERLESEGINRYPVKIKKTTRKSEDDEDE